MRSVYNKLFTNKFVRIIAIALLLSPLYLILYKLRITRINAFGCFDECFNYGAGYFLLHGKTLYSQIFFNHQPAMAYASFAIQKVFGVSDIFQLLLRHKQLQVFYSFIWGIIIIKRFRWKGVFFIIPYELSTFYIFGDRFLGEGFIVYPMAYILGIVWEKLKGITLSPYEYIWCAILAWSVVIAREPYIPYALFAFGILVWKPKSAAQKGALALFLVLLAAVYAFIPLREYWMSIVDISVKGVAKSENSQTHILGLGALEVFFYPVYVFFQGQFNALKVILLGYSTVFIISALVLLKRKDEYKRILPMLFLLGLANLRPVTPGTVFYAAFHMVDWFGMFLLLTGLLIAELKRTYQLVAYGLLIVVTIVYIFLAKDFFWSTINPSDEFFTNFGESYGLGQTVRKLATPQNTFFIDVHENLNLAYVESQRISPYSYSWYNYVAPGVPVFVTARKNMFLTNPPDFYYGQSKDVLNRDFVKKVEYINISNNGKQSELYIKKSVLSTITDAQWANVKRFGYEKPVVQEQ